MVIRFLEIARLELDEAVEYYNNESAGLGNQFLAEVLRAIDRIGEFPEAWHRLSQRTRRCRTRRFPYGIVYQIRGSEILVIAVANLRRRPEYWKDRLKD
jgi:plasmid stabilization system protein ParE